jgi:hypothetical protein
MRSIRKPAVAGTFYPADAIELRTMLSSLLSSAEAIGLSPKALIVPHAGYIYSGPVAARGYACLKAARNQIRRVVLLGPAHFAAFSGLAESSADAFATPLGVVPIEELARVRLRDLPQVHVLDRAHVWEHSLEVQLPFLQMVLQDFSLLPLAVGEASAEEVGEVLERLWGGPETLILISSDLSHYHDYETARRLDQETSKAIEKLQQLSPGQACGRCPINGLLYVARKRGLRARTIDLRNSGDTAGPRDRVVGYGTYLFEESETSASCLEASQAETTPLI